jgi:Flp pilus assembly protein TadB
VPCATETTAWPPAPAGMDIVAALPPLPPPDHAQQRRESRRGCCLVLWIVCACVVTTTTVVSLYVSSERALQRVLLLAVWAEAAVAVGCLLGIMYGDPGVVKRSTATCLPPHPEVVRRLQAGEPVADALDSNSDEPVPPFRSYAAPAGLGPSAFHRAAELVPLSWCR